MDAEKGNRNFELPPLTVCSFSPAYCSRSLSLSLSMPLLQSDHEPRKEWPGPAAAVLIGGAGDNTILPLPLDEHGGRAALVHFHRRCHVQKVLHEEGKIVGIDSADRI